jgi:hypothetical protein
MGQFRFWWPWQQTAQCLSQADALFAGDRHRDEFVKASPLITDERGVAIECAAGAGIPCGPAIVKTAAL